MSTPKSGRPPVEIDLAKLQQYGELGCTNRELALLFGVTERTVELKRQKDENFRTALERGHAKANASLRRKQMELALAGDRTMLIWLGKQRLGQKEKIDHTSEDGSTQPKRPKIYVNFVTPPQKTE